MTPKEFLKSYSGREFGDTLTFRIFIGQVRHILEVEEKDFAEMLGISVENINDWKEGISAPPTVFRNKLSQHLLAMVEGKYREPETEDTT